MHITFYWTAKLPLHFRLDLLGAGVRITSFTSATPLVGAPKGLAITISADISMNYAKYSGEMSVDCNACGIVVHTSGTFDGKLWLTLGVSILTRLVYLNSGCPTLIVETITTDSVSVNPYGMDIDINLGGAALDYCCRNIAVGGARMPTPHRLFGAICRLPLAIRQELPPPPPPSPSLAVISL